ncbi:MAG: hypothetical protein JW974_01465 [Alphaproteobacteria bacterium]|nr:hypothetical protein [Alphaproteobacteria bacterium]MBN2675451.1 hypothetical protein [Alphaproteobacteria bacterium]
MKKTLKMAIAASVLTAPAMAANLENPLYIPATGEYYSKTGAGVMYKQTDHSAALEAKNWDGQEEFPIWRLSEDAGYGITDRLSVTAKLGYTNDEDILRKGLHNGRVGVLYRIFDGIESPFVWDVYADIHLGGATAMEATLIPVNGPSFGFNYDNYTNGRWGFFAGTRVGKTWDKFTGSVFGEIHQTFGNNNNVITISDGAKTLITAMLTPSIGAGLAGAYTAGLPADFNVDLKSTTEYMTGINGFYQLNDTWSLGSGFSVRHRATNTIEAVNLNNSSDLATLSGGAVTTEQITASLADGFIGSMYDGMDEYVLSFAVSHKLTNTMQVSLYGEYTFDDSDQKSQNGTDVKAEAGVRLNVAF